MNDSCGIDDGIHTEFPFPLFLPLSLLLLIIFFLSGDMNPISKASKVSQILS